MQKKNEPNVSTTRPGAAPPDTAPSPGEQLPSQPGTKYSLYQSEWLNLLQHGKRFFVHQTRMLSEYRWVALSNVEQHSWLGYYIQMSGTLKYGRIDRGSGEMAEASERSAELRLSRSVSYGLDEDVDVTNFTRQSVTLQSN